MVFEVVGRLLHWRIGFTDIYVSQIFADGSVGPATLVTELNSTGNDYRPSVRFDGLEVVFFSDRPGLGGFDLWAATRETVFDHWLTPTNLGLGVNSTAGDQTPYLDRDRQTFVFRIEPTRRRWKPRSICDYSNQRAPIAD